jgi:hypothetical protein
VVLNEFFLTLIILSEGMVEGKGLRVRKLATVGEGIRIGTVVRFMLNLGVEIIDEFPLTIGVFSTLPLVPDPEVIFRNRKSSYTCTF